MSQYSSPTITRSHAPSRTAFAENRYQNCQSRDHCEKQKDMKTKWTTKIQKKWYQIDQKNEVFPTTFYHLAAI